MRESFALPDLDDIPDQPGPAPVGKTVFRDPPPLPLIRTWQQTLRWHVGSPTTIGVAAAAVMLIVIGALMLWAPDAPKPPTDPAARNSSTVASAGPKASMSAPSLAGQPIPGQAVTVQVTVTVTVTSDADATGSVTITPGASR